MNSIITGGYSSIEQAAGKLSNKKDTSQASGSSGISFQDILKQKKNIAEAANEVSGGEGVKFSKHADMRLKQRDITLTDEQLSRLNEGTQKAGLKGIRESLVIMDDLAFIVNTKSKTVALISLNDRWEIVPVILVFMDIMEEILL